tara:strand:+ start:965 stop:2071 length:1107 start_codon:yes stop_codon:yes gene_type:complete
LFGQKSKLTKRKITMVRIDILEQSKAVILGVQSTSLLQEEIDLFKAQKPLGFILFSRNIESADQVKALTKSLREVVGWECPILIDQEGGRVARLQNPMVPTSSPFKYFGDLYKTDMEAAKKAIALNTEMQASYLRDLGINVNCSPVMDLIVEGAHDIIGDRSFSSNPDIVYECASVVCKTFLDFNITPISKHLPGHGRALCDSHEALPTVDLDIESLDHSDFKPFKLLHNQKPYDYGVWSMVAHIVYPQISDMKPATKSRDLVDRIIRGHLNIDTFLLADDIEMKALSGSEEEKTKACLEAGMDVILACNYKLDDMKRILEAAYEMRPDSIQRFIKGEEIRLKSTLEPRDMDEISQELQLLFSKSLAA